MKKKLFGILLVLCLLLSTLSFTLPASADVDYGLQTTVRGSAILHCFDWSYNAIKEALPEIAAAGYTAVQTSPVQPPKDYNSTWTNTDGQWWKLYQPLGLYVADGNTWLGTKAELTALCTEADTYGIKVIVDIVANHLANYETSGGTFANLNPNVEADLRHAEYFHDIAEGIDYSNNSRWNITQRHMGMPDLNTGNSHVQERVLGLLKECVDCGVDGFRFDAAKHIELPTDPEDTRSNFWAYVINSINTYVEDQNKPSLFIYGEVLGGAGENTPITSYTTYMAVTDNNTGNNALGFAAGRNAGGLANSWYIEQTDPANCVIWAESHDTYIDGGSSWASDAVITNTWAIVGARADSTALFLARPNDDMGAASTDTTWKSPEVALVNRFKNHFDGTGEYLSYSDTVTYIERGVNGVVISKLDGGGSVALYASRMVDGVYTDQVTGNTFTVSNNIIRGIVGPSGVAVVYNTADAAASYSTITAPRLYLRPNSNWTQESARFAMYLYNENSQSRWVDMTGLADGAYYADVPQDTSWTGVIFCRMNPAATENSWTGGILWNQTDNLFPEDAENCYTMANGAWSHGDGSWSTYSDTITVYAVNNIGWDNMYIHYWGGNSATQWPGVQMTATSIAGLYSYDIPFNTTGIIFDKGESNGVVGTNQTGDISTGISNGAVWTIGQGCSATPDNSSYYYTVSFDANGGSGTMADQTFRSNEAQTLTSNSFTLEGYAFIGWSTTPDGVVAYTNGQSVSNLTATSGGTVTLYAKWKPVFSVAVTDSEHGTVSVNKTTAFEGDTIEITVTPEDSYVVNNVTVTYVAGTAEHSVTPKLENGRYTIVMPAYDISVRASFGDGTAPSYSGCVIERRDRPEADTYTDLRVRLRFSYNSSCYINPSYPGLTFGNSSGSYVITEVGYSLWYIGGGSGNLYQIPEHATDKVFYSEENFFDVAVVISGIPGNRHDVVFHVNAYLKYKPVSEETVIRLDAEQVSVSVSDISNNN